MFGLFDAVDNALSIVGSVLDGEDISRKQVSKLISDGLSIAAVASITGIAIETIKEWIDES